MENCIKNDLILNVKQKNISRFKAGAELSGKVANSSYIDHLIPI